MALTKPGEGDVAGLPSTPRLGRRPVTCRKRCRTAWNVSLFLGQRPPSRPHCHSCLAKRGSRGRPDWPSFGGPGSSFGNGQRRFRSEGGRAMGRCYSFLKLSLTARRAWPSVGTRLSVRDITGPQDDPCWHVSIALDAGHPTGACKVPLHQRVDVSSKAGRPPRLVCAGNSMSIKGRQSPPNPSRGWPLAVC